MSEVARSESLFRKFLDGISWIAFFFLAARLASALLHLSAARILGPRAYGRFHLALAMSDGLALLSTLGLPAMMVQRMAIESEQRERDATVCAAFLLCALATAVLWLLACGPGPFWARGVRIEPNLLRWSLFYTTCLSIHTLCFSVLLGRLDFKHRGIAEAIFQVAALVLFCLLSLAAKTDFSTLLLSLGIAYLGGAAYSVSAWPKVSWKLPNRKAWRAMLHYSGLALLWMLSSMLILSSGKIILNYSRGEVEVGLFGAYFTMTVLVGAALSGIISTVLFPTASSVEAQDWAEESFARLVPLSALPLSLLFLLTGGLGIFLLGRDYSLHAAWLPIFAMTAALFFLRELAGQFLAARGVSGIKTGVAGGFVVAGIQIAMGLWLIPRFGAVGAILSLFCGLCGGILFYWNWYRQRCAVRTPASEGGRNAEALPR